MKSFWAAPAPSPFAAADRLGGRDAATASGVAGEEGFPQAEDGQLLGLRFDLHGERQGVTRTWRPWPPPWPR